MTFEQLKENLFSGYYQKHENGKELLEIDFQKVFDEIEKNYENQLSELERENNNLQKEIDDLEDELSLCCDY